MPRARSIASACPSAESARVEAHRAPNRALTEPGERTREALRRGGAVPLAQPSAARAQAGERGGIVAEPGLRFAERRGPGRASTVRVVVAGPPKLRRTSGVAALVEAERAVDGRRAKTPKRIGAAAEAHGPAPGRASAAPRSTTSRAEMLAPQALRTGPTNGTSP